MKKKIEAIVAYYDICGFSDCVRNDDSKADEMLCFIGKAMDAACSFKLGDKHPYKYQQFSDSVLFYYEIGENKNDPRFLITFLEIIGTVQYEAFVRFGLPIRGAVMKGPIYVSGTISGSTVVNVYEMESRVAEWFRVILDRNVIEMLPEKCRNIASNWYDEHGALNFLLMASYTRPGSEIELESKIEGVLNSFRKKLLETIYDESLGQFKVQVYDRVNNMFKIVKPCDAETVDEFCKASILENKYGMFIQHYNDVCRSFSMEHLCIDVEWRDELVCVTVSQIKQHMQKYPKNALALKMAVKSLLNQFEKRKY